jgi:hypothetical protein
MEYFAYYDDHVTIAPLPQLNKGNRTVTLLPKLHRRTGAKGGELDNR